MVPTAILRMLRIYGHMLTYGLMLCIYGVCILHSPPPHAVFFFHSLRQVVYVQVKECPAAHVISGILNIVNGVRHYLVIERLKECQTAHDIVISMFTK